MRRRGLEEEMIVRGASARWWVFRLYPARLALILVWGGFMSTFRGITHISLAFAVRRAGKELQGPTAA